jgi:transcriptional regulator with XRE-family HTH domain
MADYIGHKDVIQPCQCRAARGLLDWTQDRLAEAAGVSRSTIRDFENGRRVLHRGTADLVAGALSRAGVILIGPDGGGYGVRFAAALSG